MRKEKKVLCCNVLRSIHSENEPFDPIAKEVAKKKLSNCNTSINYKENIQKYLDDIIAEPKVEVNSITSSSESLLKVFLYLKSLLLPPLK